MSVKSHAVESVREIQRCSAQLLEQFFLEIEFRLKMVGCRQREFWWYPHELDPARLLCAYNQHFIEV
jgi:hypothetical protein